MTPTEVVYDDGRPSVAGLVAGSALTLPGTGRYAIFLVFPLTQEVNTLEVLRYAVVSTGAVLVLMLTFIAALVARQVVVPGPGRPAGRREPGLGQPARPDAGARAGRPGPAGHLDERHGRGDGEADHHAVGAVAGAAALRLRRVARAPDAADHRPDGRRGAARRPRRLRPGVRPVGRAAADRAGPLRVAAQRPAGDLPLRRRRGRAHRRDAWTCAGSSTGSWTRRRR